MGATENDYPHDFRKTGVAIRVPETAISDEIVR